MSFNRGVAGYACLMAVSLDGVTQARYQVQRLASGHRPDAKQYILYILMDPHGIIADF